ncbi:MAG TPA: hypothetical protein VHC71_01145 [Hyphomicrobium sp.]|jgi:hypothetical protein|nr:hypothetical protein [Hyphomicrobium sp.]
MPNTIKVAAGVYQAEKRKVDRMNVGFYCNKCDEFFAIAVAPKGADAKILETIIDLEPGVMFECPMCHEVQERQSSEVARIRLTPGKTRRPHPPKDAH